MEREAKAAERARLYGDVGMVEPSELGSTGVVMVGGWSRASSALRGVVMVGRMEPSKLLIRPVNTVRPEPVEEPLQLGFDGLRANGFYTVYGPNL